ncbi:MAG: hypothetical protein K2P95_04155 [Hyphomonadaceae bacterium]|nr:hypothetical protein [Hyphomonadaceae bacterium]
MSPAALLDLVLLLTSLELAALALWRWRKAGAGAAVSALAALVPGLCLMLAVRAGLHGQGDLALAWVTAALPAHLFDLHRRRWAA